jgi:hypothetical protein
MAISLMVNFLIVKNSFFIFIRQFSKLFLSIFVFVNIVHVFMFIQLSKNSIIKIQVSSSIQLPSIHFSFGIKDISFANLDIFLALVSVWLCIWSMLLLVHHTNGNDRVGMNHDLVVLTLVNVDIISELKLLF